jgi:hypothetical protein
MEINIASLTRNRDGRWRAVELFINSCASLAERRGPKTCQMASHGHFLHVPLLRLSLMLIIILVSRNTCKHFPYPHSPFPFVCKFVQPINFLIGFLLQACFFQVSVPTKNRVIECTLAGRAATVRHATIARLGHQQIPLGTGCVCTTTFIWNKATYWIFHANYLK